MVPSTSEQPMPAPDTHWVMASSNGQPITPVPVSYGFVIGTSSTRTVKKGRNRGVRKYVQMQAGGKFKFVTELHQATVFSSMATLLQAYGVRCQGLSGSPTTDLVVHRVGWGSTSIITTLA